MPKIKKIHFIGIGGISMSGIAKILFYQGHKISGSDISANKITKQLTKLGIHINYKHSAKNINHPDIIVKSSAIPKKNPEIIEAKKLNIPIIKRAEMLAKIMNTYYGIAVAGTHGKTTTTTMIVDIYQTAGIQPTFVNGGIRKKCNLHAELGNSKYFITEADESDASLIYLQPKIAIITNIEQDHMQTYKGNFVLLQKTFIKFIKNLPKNGVAILCIDNPAIQKILPKIKNCKIITYGFNQKANFCIQQYKQYQKTSTFHIHRNKKKPLQIHLNIPGYHNALNATAAIITAQANNIKTNIILKTMSRFQNVNRRLHNLGYFCIKKKQKKIITFMLIDDYGHHPNEIQNNIQTIRISWPKKRLVMIFQPHRYTRTQDLYKNFVHILGQVDMLILLKIDPAGEKPITHINSNTLCHAIHKKKQIKPIFIKNTKKIPKTLQKILQNNDLLLMQGAGTIAKITQQITDKFPKKNTKFVLS
ncbi:MAG: UDP-N-acetylmuramate--L-alanine ligase [Candidatus Westeberhardia cardiocondylae]|nr:UDP-N-acetylmuramate--L-alanine ligase [Candidatus Westeberhardia cardiocondylae]